MAVKLGEMLVKAGLITQDQLQEALTAQRQSGEKLGFALVNLGYVREDEITHLLSEQYGVPSINLRHFEIEDKAMEQRLIAFAEEEGLQREELASPMFTCSRGEFAEFAEGKSRLLMGDFYKQQRRRLGILVDDNGEPDGGRWSFDVDNRKSIATLLTNRNHVVCD